MDRHRLQAWCCVFTLSGFCLDGIISAVAWQQNPDSERSVILRVGKDNKGDLWEASFLQLPTDSTEVRGRVGDMSLLMKIKQFTSFPVTVEPSPEASEQEVEETIAALYKAGIENLHMLGPYFADTGRLYYFGSTEKGITAPKLGLDREKLHRIAVASGVREKILSMSTGEKWLGYHLLLDEMGRLVKIRQNPPPPPQFPELEKALAEAKVLAPGRRGQEPVRSVVFVMIDLK